MLLDGPPSSIEDLTARDSDLLPVALTENIDLSAKIRLAASDIGVAVESMLRSAVSFGNLLRYPNLTHIAVTAPLKLWHTFMSLRLVYQDVYFSRLNDRYQAKMKLYREEENRALDGLRTNGLGIVFDPLPQASEPNIATVQSPDAAGTMYVAVAFVNRRREEGAASMAVEVDTQGGTAASVSITGAPENASGWNLYAGIAPDGLTRQNSQVLSLTANATLAPGSLVTGPAQGHGQHANQLVPIPLRILRG
jgi:hypothetical protein